MKSFTLTPNRRSATVYVYKYFCSVRISGSNFADGQLIIEQRDRDGSWNRCAAPVLSADQDWFTFNTTERRQRLRFTVVGGSGFSVPVDVKQTVHAEYDYIATALAESGSTGGTVMQSLGSITPNDLPNSTTVDLSLGQIAVGHLTGNTVITLTGATAGDTGMLLLGNGAGHDGVGYTVSFTPGATLTHGASGHDVMVGDLADFAAAPAAGEYNFGTIAWIYTGQEYLLYVSDVKPFTDAIALPA